MFPVSRNAFSMAGQAPERVAQGRSPEISPFTIKQLRKKHGFAPCGDEALAASISRTGIRLSFLPARQPWLFFLLSFGALIRIKKNRHRLIRDAGFRGDHPSRPSARQPPPARWGSRKRRWRQAETASYPCAISFFTTLASEPVLQSQAQGGGFGIRSLQLAAAGVSVELALLAGAQIQPQ